MFKTIFKELGEHAPFTFMGALAGILLFMMLRNITSVVSFDLFYIFHPLHVFLSAYVTASMYKLNKKNPSFIKILLVGVIGSVCVASLSDSVLPFLGESLLRFPLRELHLGFIEKWYIVNPLAIFGVLLANKNPSTKFPHSGHIFLSTSASLLHIVMSIGLLKINILLFFEITFLLFLSVWLPCCFSDIVFPLMFVDKNEID